MRNLAVVLAVLSVSLVSNSAFAQFEISCQQNLAAIDGVNTSVTLKQNGDSRNYSIVIQDQGYDHVANKAIDKKEKLGSFNCTNEFIPKESFPVQYLLKSASCGSEKRSKGGKFTMIRITQGENGQFSILRENHIIPKNNGMEPLPGHVELGDRFNCSVVSKPVGSPSSSGSSGAAE